MWVATCAGVGYFPRFPGTAGAALGLGLVVALGRLPLGRVWLEATLATVAAGLFCLGVWASGRAARFFGHADPAPAVIDEVVGQVLTFMLRPEASWKLLAVGFVLFRFWDVVKPFPARRAEQVRGGWGIMLDDVIAAAYSLGCLWLVGALVK